MSLFIRLAKYAGMQIMQRPEVREKAAKVVREEVVPRAREGLEKARPHIDQARTRVRNTVDELKEISKETDPVSDPKEFVRRSYNRLTGNDDKA